MPNDKSHYEEIKNWLRLIKLQPKNNKFFYLENEDTCIINAKMIKFLDIKLSSTYEECYVHIDTKQKYARFSAFNTDFKTNRIIEQSDGTILWKEIEWPLLVFLCSNSQRLTSASPNERSRIAQTTTQPSSTTTRPPYSQTQSSSYSEHNKDYTRNDNLYGSEDYKLRENIRNKFDSLVKEHKIGNAIDYMTSELKDLIDKNKLDNVDLLLLGLTPDTLPVPALLSILKITQPVSKSLKDRGSLITRVRTKMEKSKAYPKSIKLLNAVEEQTNATQQ